MIKRVTADKLDNIIMNLLTKTCVVLFVSSLAACGDSDTDVATDGETAQQEQKADAGSKKPFIFQDMKESLDAAKAVDKTVQERNAQQKKELDGI